MNKKLIYLIKYIDSGYNKGSTFIDIKKTSAIISFCKLLVKEGIIKSFDSSDLFYKSKFNILRIYLLSYNLSNDGTHVKFKPYNKIEINYKSLIRSNTLMYKTIKRLFRLNIIHLLSTDKGFITCKDALNLKIGGFLVCKIWV